MANNDRWGRDSPREVAYPSDITGEVGILGAPLWPVFVVSVQPFQLGRVLFRVLNRDMPATIYSLFSQIFFNGRQRIIFFQHGHPCFLSGLKSLILVLDLGKSGLHGLVQFFSQLSPSIYIGTFGG